MRNFSCVVVSAACIATLIGMVFLHLILVNAEKPGRAVMPELRGTDSGLVESADVAIPSVNQPQMHDHDTSAERVVQRFGVDSFAGVRAEVVLPSSEDVTPPPPATARPALANPDLRASPPEGSRELPPMEAALQRTPWVILASHNRLAWFHLVTGELRVIHEGQGVYYGTSAGHLSPQSDGVQSLSTIWVIQRPHNVGANAEMGAAVNTLTHIALSDGERSEGTILQKVALESQFTHDALQDDDDIYVCDTGHGRILKYTWLAASAGSNDTWELRGTYELFGSKEHINTVSILDRRYMLAMWHNSRDPSFITKIDRSSGEVVETYDNLGRSCHGCSPWRDYIIFLDSPRGALMKLPMDKTSTESQRTLFADSTKPKPRFAKGLLVIGDVAVFGLSEPMNRESRASLTNNCDIVVFDLVSDVKIQRFRGVQTQGLLNSIQVPQLFARGGRV